MPYDIQLTDDNDLPSVPRWVTGPALTRQRLRVAVGLHLGEWLLDASVGVPWSEWTQQRPPHVDDMTARLRALIASTPGVAVVQSFAGDYDVGTRTVTFSGNVLLVDQAEPEEVTVSTRVEGNSPPRVFFRRAKPC